MKQMPPPNALTFTGLLLAATLAAVPLSIAAAAPGGNAVSAELSAPTISATIKNCAYGTRDSVLDDIVARLDTVGRALSNLEDTARSLPEKSRENFQQAMAEVKNQQEELKRNVENARKATEEAWQTQRTELASSYGNYASAVTRAEAAANVPK